jgi:hypothetical protein
VRQDDKPSPPAPYYASRAATKTGFRVIAPPRHAAPPNKNASRPTLFGRGLTAAALASGRESLGCSLRHADRDAWRELFVCLRWRGLPRLWRAAGPRSAPSRDRRAWRGAESSLGRGDHRSASDPDGTLTQIDGLRVSARGAKAGEGGCKDRASGGDRSSLCGWQLSITSLFFCLSSLKTVRGVTNVVMVSKDGRFGVEGSCLVWNDTIASRVSKAVEGPFFRDVKSEGSTARKRRASSSSRT